jgi:heme exporter protein B
MNIFWQILKRDIGLRVNSKYGLLQLLSFFLIIITLFPLAIGPRDDILIEIAPAIILVVVMLLSSLSLPAYFENDYDDGTLEQYYLLPTIGSSIVLAKIISNWISTSLPLIIFSPIVAIVFGMDSESIKILILSLLFATPTISLIGCMSASLALGANKSSILYSVLALPLYIPVLIFCSGQAVVVVSETSATMALASIFLLMLPLSVFVSIYSLKSALNN